MSIPFTLLSSDHCALTKEFTINDGQIRSSTIANMATGHAKRVHVQDVTELRFGLASLAANQAICCGLNLYGDTPITTRRRAAQDTGAVPRITDAFAWPQGPALFAIDVDVEPNSEYRSVDAVLTALESCSEWLKDVLRVARPSSSSYVGNRGLRGVHVYFAVTDGQKIPELGKRLQQDQWLAGKGYVKVSRSGALLVRQLADVSIYQTQRILFEAAPLLGDGVTRDIPAGEEWIERARQTVAGRPPGHAENGMLNVSKLAPLKQLQLRQVETAIAMAKHRAKAYANRVAFDWHKQRSLVQGWSEDAAERLATAAIYARDSKQLTADTCLRFEQEGLVRVANVLYHWEQFVGEHCTTPDDALRDDLEPRHFTKAIVTVREGRKGLFSYKDNEFYVFQEQMTPKLNRWLQASLKLEGCIEYPEPMRTTTPLVNAKLALAALNDEVGKPLRYNAATFTVDALPISDTSQILDALSRVGCRGMTAEGVQRAMDAVAHEHVYDPWREAIERLPVWDSIERLDTLLRDVCGAVDSEALMLTSRALFAAIVRRQLHPGATQGVIPVLIGDQGVGKSRHFVKALATALGCPAVPQIEFQDADKMSRAARISMIAELAEMSGHGKKDAEAVKLWATNNDDVYRDLYARDSTSHPRRFVLIGTANKHELNNDETGNRRFMPVMVTQAIDPNWVIELPQILAEARDRFCQDDDAYGALCADASRVVLAHNIAEMRRGDGTIHDTIDDLLPGILNRLARKSATVDGATLRTALDATPSGRLISSRRVGQWLLARGWFRRRVSAGYVFDAPSDFIATAPDDEPLQTLNPFAPYGDEPLTTH